MSKVYTEADLAAAFELGYWRGTSHEGPLNDAAVAAKNPHRAQGVTPAKVCKVALKTEKDRDASPKSVTAIEPNLYEGDSQMNTTKYAATVREPNTVAPRLLEVLGSIPKPPAGFTPDYFLNEFCKNPEPEPVGYSAPDIERPGYKILSSWTPEDGVQLCIDHENDESFTMAEVRDLITTLQEALAAVAKAAEV